MQGREKITFRKKSGESKLRDSLLFILIFVLCIATIVTMQIKSQKNKKTDAVNSEAVNTVNVDETPDDIKDTEYKYDFKDEAHETKTEENLNVTNDIKNNSENEYVFKYQKPLNGEILKEYSDNELLYSKTMEDWRLHLGTDIAAPIGTKVMSCEKGVVEDVYKDENYGITVVIKHTETVKSIYSNLASDVYVKKDDKLNKGDLIGVVGDTGISEILDDAHIHFSIKENDKFINPKKYILDI